MTHQTMHEGRFRPRTAGTAFSSAALLTALLFALPVFSFGQQTQSGGPAAEDHGPMMEAQEDPALGSGMIGGMHGGGPIESEEDFLLEMIPHHLEAADAAVLVSVTTGDDEIRSLTENIYRTQYREVEQLKIQYARIYRQLPTGRPYERMMRDLNVVEGEARDRVFVEDMIPHHESAVWMARRALALSGISEETRSFAERVVRDQNREIAFMKEWLARKGYGAR